MREQHVNVKPARTLHWCSHLKKKNCRQTDETDQTDITWPHLTCHMFVAGPRYSAGRIVLFRGYSAASGPPVAPCRVVSTARGASCCGGAGTRSCSGSSSGSSSDGGGGFSSTAECDRHKSRCW